MAAENEWSLQLSISALLMLGLRLLRARPLLLLSLARPLQLLLALLLLSLVVLLALVQEPRYRKAT